MDCTTYWYAAVCCVLDLALWFQCLAQIRKWSKNRKIELEVVNIENTENMKIRKYENTVYLQRGE